MEYPISSCGSADAVLLLLVSFFVAMVPTLNQVALWPGGQGALTLRAAAFR